MYAMLDLIGWMVNQKNVSKEESLDAVWDRAVQISLSELNSQSKKVSDGSNIKADYPKKNQHEMSEYSGPF